MIDDDEARSEIGQRFLAAEVGSTGHACVLGSQFNNRAAASRADWPTRTPLAWALRLTALITPSKYVLWPSPMRAVIASTDAPAMPSASTTSSAAMPLRFLPMPPSEQMKPHGRKPRK